MEETRVLLVFPGSLCGGRWADGPRLKPEMVGLFSELRRGGFAVDALDLEIELGNPRDTTGREAFLMRVEGLLAARPADLVVISCWSALQYTATVAVAQTVRRLHPAAVIAVEGYHVSVRPNDFNGEAAPFDWLVAGEAEEAVLDVARAIAGGDRRIGLCRSLEGAPLPLDEEHRPRLADYPYAGEGLAEVTLSLSRGCPYTAPACLLRPGGLGWHAYPPEVALALVDEAVGLRPRHVRVLDPAFGFEAAWRRTMLGLLGDRRDPVVSVASRPEALTRRDVEMLYGARLHLRLDVGTLSRELLSRTGLAPQPRKAVEQALDLLAYINAKGLVATVGFTFNRPGETRETAAETLDALERFVAQAPNASVTLQAQSWAFLPAGDSAADVEAPAQRFGTRILEDEWWKRAVDAQAAATAVIASHELSDLPAGDESYWRSRFEDLRGRLSEKLTNSARHGLRSHNTVGSEAGGVPHGWWAGGRWH
jgi:hypothetical protein